MSGIPLKHPLLASDLDQTLSFNDSGLVLSEMLGVTGFEERAVQMFGALLWITHGVLIKASPVVVANVLVFSAAAWTFLRQRPAR